MKNNYRIAGTFSSLRLCLCALLVVALLPRGEAQGSPSQRAEPSMTPEMIKHLDQDKFEELRSTRDFPEGVKAYYQGNSDDISQVMADPGESFEAGCVRTGKNPSKGLLVACKSKALCLVYFQSGGFALLDTIEILRLAEPKKAEKIWSSSMFAQHPKNMNELLQAARERVKNPIR